MKTKLFSLFLALVASAGTIFAWDYERVLIGNLYYNLDAINLTAEVTYKSYSYLAYNENWNISTATIPETVQYNSITYSVTSIGNQAFSNCSSLTSVEIPNSVTSIGGSAFYGCSGLTSVTIPNCVTSIGNYAFFGCSGLTSVIIGNSVTSIGKKAFEGCKGLTSVTIPNSVTSIGELAFYCCSSLTSIMVDDGNEHYDSRNNCNAIIETTSNTLITGSNSTIIPYGVTSIKQYAFSYCSALTSVDIPNSVTSIGDYAFSGCIGLTSVTIPNSVTSIGENAFSYCRGLTSVTIPNSVTSIGNQAFSNCSSLTSVEIPNSVTSIGENAFSYCRGLTSVTIPNSVTSIGEKAFESCGLTSVTIPNSVKSIQQEAFRGCNKLTSVICEAQTPPAISMAIFFNCNNLSSIYVPCGTLDAYKQSWSKYDEIIKNHPLESITTKVNINDAGYVTLPSSICDDTIITAVPNYGYHFVQWNDGNTDNPRTIELTQDTTFTAEFTLDVTGSCGKDNLLTWRFDSVRHTLTISGDGLLDCNYKFGVQAPTQTERLVIEEGITAIGDTAFYGLCENIISLALPSTLATIGDSAFVGLSNRKFNSLTLPNTIISIGAHAFDGASYLQTIHFGSALEEIGENAFYGCTRVGTMTCLSEITPNVATNGLESINSNAILNVLNSCLQKYKVDENWNRFIIQPLGTSDVLDTDNEVNVVADNNSATFTWPTSNNAELYELVITKDGEIICTLLFNGSGQLVGIAFVPSHEGSSHAPSAVMTAAGMQFTVTGLSYATRYNYALTVKDGSSNELASYSGSFGTTDAPEGIEDVTSQEPTANSQKLLRDGQILILRGEKTYTVTGQKVR